MALILPTECEFCGTPFDGDPAELEAAHGDGEHHSGSVGNGWIYWPNRLLSCRPCALAGPDAGE